MSFAKRTFLLFCSTMLAMAVLAAPVFAQNNCLQDEYNTVNKQNLNCTANDVRVADVSGVTDLSGNPLSTCIEGSQFSFIANFHIITTANAVNAGGRDNVGLYFQTDDTRPDALFGKCVDNIIAPAHQCSGGVGTCGVTSPGGYQEDDPAPDNCGDTSSSVNPNITDRIVVNNFDCLPPAGVTTPNCTANGQPAICLALPNCTSWQVPGKQIQCVSPAPDYPYEIAAIPGSPSKCNCSIIPLPITIIAPEVTVAKSCNTTLSTGADLTSCDAGEDGGPVTYHVAVTNTSANGGVTVDQICDSAYGNIFTASTFTGASCPAGSVGSKTGTTCGALDIANGATGTCDFTANQAGPSEAAATLTVTNQLKVSGHSDLLTTKTFGPTLSNSVTVTSEESPSVATVTKGTVANLHACVTLRYSVDVANKSGADESLTLSALSDSAFGDITTVHGDVLATTCGGTAGTLPATLAVGGADYKCTFDAVICSDLPAGTTCFSHVNKVTGTISSEEAGDAVTQTGNTLTAQECVTLTPSSTTP